MSFVAVDIGASSTRYVNERGQINVAPNNMVLFDTDELSRVNPDTSELEDCLEVYIRKVNGPECPHFPAHFLAGFMAEKYSSNNIRPSALMPKHNQRINYLSLIMSCALSKIKYPMEDMISLYFTVPPLQVDATIETMAPMLPGTYEVHLPKYINKNGQGTVVTFTIKDDIVIKEEAFMAITSFFFNMNGTLKPQYQSILPGNTMSIDIGATTTDLVAAKLGRYLEHSGDTYQLGGNIARSYLTDAIRKKFTIEIPVDSADIIMREGRMQLGATYVDVSDIVSSAKKELAQKIIANLGDYFGKIGIPISQFSAFVVSGGGSIQSQYVNENGEIVKTSEPMSYYVAEELKNICKTISVIPYGDDSRMANIKGMFIYASMYEAKKLAQQQAQNGTTA